MLATNTLPRPIQVSDEPTFLTIGESRAWLNVSRMWVLRYRQQLPSWLSARRQDQREAMALR
jgi:hypothetical protein